MAGRINVDTEIELVSKDLRRALRRLTDTDGPATVGAPSFSGLVEVVADPRRGYLQEFDPDQLADWAAAHECTIQLLVRPGDYVFPGAPIALAEPNSKGTELVPTAYSAPYIAAVHVDVLEPERRQTGDVHGQQLVAFSGSPPVLVAPASSTAQTVVAMSSARALLRLRA